MKAIGIVRNIDLQGRVVLPAETRMILSMEAGKDAVEMFIEEDKIILKKYAPACMFCGNADELQTFHGNKICPDCIKNLNKLIGGFEK